MRVNLIEVSVVTLENVQEGNTIVSRCFAGNAWCQVVKLFMIPRERIDHKGSIASPKLTPLNSLKGFGEALESGHNIRVDVAELDPGFGLAFRALTRRMASLEQLGLRCPLAWGARLEGWASFPVSLPDPGRTIFRRRDHFPGRSPS